MHLVISTHALREEGDAPTTSSRWTSPPNFYPRPPRGGRPIPTLVANIPEILFLPTPSARRATFEDLRANHPLLFLPTPSARRATLALTLKELAYLKISTHALREEGDPRRGPPCKNRSYFYPRPPRGGRPAALTEYGQCIISTHALREEGD